MPDIYKQETFQNIILIILWIIVIIVIIGCIYALIRAIFYFIFSHQKEEYRKKWQNSIRFMIIWIILTIVLLLIIPTIFRLMNVPDYQNYTTKNIFNEAGKLINSAFNLWDIIKKSQKANQYQWDLYYDDSSDQLNSLSDSQDYQL